MVVPIKVDELSLPLQLKIIFLFQETMLNKLAWRANDSSFKKNYFLKTCHLSARRIYLFYFLELFLAVIYRQLMYVNLYNQ